MMRRRGAGLVLLAFVAASAQLPLTWQHWQYSAPIEGPSARTPGLVGVTLPAAVMSRAAAGWADLRVIDAQGAEVPYVLWARLGGRSVEHRPTRFLDPSASPGQYAEAIVDAGAGSQVHNAVTLRIAGPDDLLTWAEIAVSDDRKEWRIVRERAPIYRLTRERIGERTEVSYPDSGSRYLRIRILDDTGNARLIGAEVAYEVVTEAERVPADVPLASDTSVSKQTAWASSADVPVPLSEVRFVTAEPVFYRPVSVETRDADEPWVRAASGEIFRVPERGTTRAALAVTFPEVTAHRWRVVVHDRNDAPITDLRATFYTTPRRVVFSQQPGASYRLLYGNARAKVPQYGIARLMDARAIEAAAEVTLGAEELNRGWIDPAPWTERHEVVLWAALAVAAVVLGYLAIRTLRG